MSAEPRWEGVDNATADLLSLVELGPLAPDTADREWAVFVAALRSTAASHAGIVFPNSLRPLVKDKVAPQRTGAFTRRAMLEGLIVAEGYEISDDLASRNRGRPMRTYRWTGGAS